MNLQVHIYAELCFVFHEMRVALCPPFEQCGMTKAGCIKVAYFEEGAQNVITHFEKSNAKRRQMHHVDVEHHGRRR